MKGVLRIIAATYRKVVSALVMVTVVAGYFVYRNYFQPRPPAPVIHEVLQLNNDIWTEAERQRYYHLSQGSQLMPYDWFIALEQKDKAEPFGSDAHMSTFRFIPDPNPLGNPDRLPIGIAKDDPDPVTGAVNVGITCAACHTAQITYRGVGIRIDGGPGLANLDALLENVLVSLSVTVISESSAKFERFAKKVLNYNYNKENSKKLFSNVRNYVEQQLKLKLEEKLSDAARGQRRTESGFGRLDGLGSGGNRIYRLLGKQNLRTLNAPVKALPLWHTHDYNWLQTNGSMRQPLARNVVQALTVNSSLVFPGDPGKNDRYISSVRLKNLVELEKITQRFKPPVWPERVLGPINHEAAARGEITYKKQCAFCHEPQKESQPQAGDAVATRNNKTYFVLRTFPVDKIRTDPNDALNFSERTVDASSIQMGNAIPGPEMIRMVLSGVINRQFADLNLPIEQREEWSGYRDNLLRICKGYTARPLAGAWACAPYLHNGSIRSLYQLLLTPAERDKIFFTGDFEFDPVNVGFVSSVERGGFKFDTSISGNSNAGHQFGTSLKHEEKMDLIEYLKVLKFPDSYEQVAASVAGCN